MSWLTGKVDANARLAHISLGSTSIFLVYSYLALLVMNFDRYMATSYPIFHHRQYRRQGLETPNVLRAPSVMRPAADLSGSFKQKFSKHFTKE
jgi:hypothetical protein